MIDAPIPRRARLFAEAVALRLGLGRRLRERSLPELLRSLTPARPPATPAPLLVVEQSLRAAEALLERLGLVPDTCLYRALARYAVLARTGHPARFVMGIRPPATREIQGHAWVEVHGAPAFEEADPSLVVTFAYPERPDRSRMSP